MFELTGSTVTNKNTDLIHVVRIKTIERVRQSISENPTLTVRKRNQTFNLKKPVSACDFKARLTF